MNRLCCRRVALAAVFLLALLVGSFDADPATVGRPSPAVRGSLADVAGVCVVDLSTGRVVADINSGRGFIPASVTKALTTATVMCLKDSAERFVTPVMAFGRVNRGTLEGNLVVGCSGDPTIESRHFPCAGGFADSVAVAVKRLGITRIAGRVMIDDSAFAECGIPAGWMDEDLIETYGTAHHAANYADNCVTLNLVTTEATPSTPGLKVVRHPSKGGARLSRSRASETISYAGRAPRKGGSRRIANPVPRSTLLAAIGKALAASGVTVANGNVTPSPGFVEPVYTHFSPRYVDIMRSLMVRSDNLFAEGMLRTLAPGDSRGEALAEQRDVWLDNGVDLRGLTVEDGSGLSRNNRMTPRFLASVLEWMAGSLLAESYVRLFPRAGCEGTVRGFLKDTPLQGRLVLKSGSMRGVQSYAGYYLAEDGTPTHAVVLMANGFRNRGALKTSLSRLLLEIFAPEDCPAGDISAEN